VIEQLLPHIKGENIPSVDTVFLHMNPSNPVFVSIT
jgi:hypothetical protein